MFFTKLVVQVIALCAVATCSIVSAFQLSGLCDSLGTRLQAPHGVAFVAELKVLDDRAQPEALRYYEQLWEEHFPEVLNQTFAAIFVVEMMGAGLRCLFLHCFQDA